MNYLIQAYACSSYQGGEYAVSWGWITHLSQAVSCKDKIYVVSLTLTQKELDDNNLKNIKLLKVKGMEKYNFLNYNQIYYKIWQKKAYFMVKKLKIDLDVVHVYSLSDFRQPGDWYKIKNTYTILGPVGGGQICPASLISYDDMSGKIRQFINWFCKNNPLFRKKIGKFARVYACNRETQKYLKNAEILPDVPLNDSLKNLKIIKREHKVRTILYVGRLINKKGLKLLLDVLDYIDSNITYQVLIYGEGDQRDILEDIITKKKLEDKVFLKGKVPYNEISKTYQEGDIFVLPSLRESGGSVLIEAMAHQLPIVALDMSLAHLLNQKKCGMFVNINQKKEGVLKQFANILMKLLSNSELREFYGNNGYRYVNQELTWDNMIDEVYGEFIKKERC